MSTHSQVLRGGFWRRDTALAGAVVLVVLALHLGTDAIGMLERRFYDFASTHATAAPSPRITVVAIDDASIAALGRWPWPREVHAGLIDRLSAAGARTIVHTSLFLEPEVDRGLAHIRRIREAAGPQGRVASLAAEAERALDSDSRLTDSLRRAGNVLLPAVFTLGEPLGPPDAPMPPWVLRDAVPQAGGFSVAALAGQYPIEPLGRAAAGIGHVNQLHDVDGAVRQEPLLVSLQGQALPSLALRAAAHSLNLGPADIRLEPGRAVRVGGLRVPTDETARLLPRFHAYPDGRAAFAMDSFHEVLAGRVPASRFQGRIVVIGATAAGVGARFPTPGHAALSPVEWMAHTTSAILAGDAVVRPAWGLWAGLAALLAVAGYLMACLPRLSARQGAAATAGLFSALLLGEYLLLARLAWWLELVLPATLLLAGHLALTTRRFLVTEAGKVKADDESAEANRMMGLALQGQGQLDMAFDRFRRVPPSDALMDNLYHLALDFERKRQFNKAEAVYAHMAAWNPRYKDVPERQQRVRKLSNTVMLGGGATHPGGSMILDLDTLERPMLGRYALEKELGKGAMGVVYLGRDPKIGRVVAIKTMALGQEFEGEALAQARERFFREAETAGRLQHPGIVTIHDAGEDQDLAYIAMEFLQGHDLGGHTRAGALLPARQVVEIGVHVAQALAYAHRQNVVHRDIKPSNIMWDPASGAVKVTDFGIARITDASRTRTGMVMGTPSFMPPEQLAGQKADGRCDIYALGVTLYQLLTGELPFGGESLAQLMYKIANEPAPDLRVQRPDLPQALARVVARALHKDPGQRYQDGDAMAADLLDAMASLPLHTEVAAPVAAGAAGAFDATVTHIPTAAAPSQAP